VAVDTHNCGLFYLLGICDPVFGMVASYDV